MVDIVRRKDARITAPDVSSSQKALASGLEKMGTLLGAGGKKLEKMGIAEQKQAERDYLKGVQDNLSTEQKRLADQQKTFDAADKLVAADMSGRLRNDLLRWNMEQREKNPATIGTPEHERAMRDQYARLSKQYGAGLGEVGTAAFNEKTQATVNDFIQNDIKWSYQKKIKQAEQAAKDAAKAAEQTAAAYGANGDVDGFKQAHSENRQVLEEYANDVAPAGANQALAELDKNALLQFYNNLAQTNPVMAKALLDSMENFKETVPDEMLQNASNEAINAKEKDIKEKLILINSGIANEKENSSEAKRLKKLKKQYEKELDKIGKEDFEKQSLEKIHKDVKEAVGKTIDYNLNLQKAAMEEEKQAKRVENSLLFMDNPIIYSSDIFRENPELQTRANEIYDISDRVGDGKVDPDTLNMIVGKVASITLGDSGSVDDNILKAFDAELALRKAGASPAQLQEFHQLTQRAMTDTNFKQSVAALASKPDFNTMFLNRPSRDTGLRSWFRTVQEDDTDYVEDMGRQAYFGAFNLMIQGKPDEALAYYDSKVSDAYDFIKRDVIDVDYVKAQLAKTGSAMIELNGNMTKIIGRLPNGEYIIEDTGEKINGGF